ncbi:CueP family metal-binding protein [Pseudactinotalea sp.]|uniref:CueP family metal-binding protein n=1 Tax=Pseudactinotalea sp. TaxID=1926260 RepID=UPI003B3A99A6
MISLRRLLVSLTGLALVVSATAGCSAEDAAAPAVLDLTSLAEMDVVDMIDLLESMPPAERPEDVMVSVRSDEVLLADATGAERVVAAPEGMFHLSIAPYREHTHGCYFHSLTTCTGELAATDVDVTVVDLATGEVLVEESTQTYDNGYVAYWLPDDIEAEVTITSDGRSGSAVVTTGVDDLTCLTTLRLT